MVVPGVVLDSNVLLDWLVFDDPSVLPLVQAIQMRSVRWLTSDSLRAELADVLLRKPWRGPAADPVAVWRAYGDWAHTVVDQVPSGTATRLRCRDPDDQKFIDLTLMHGARWLISRDKAVLSLARRARPLGLIIAKPAQWAIDTAIIQA
jgi:predicted nucleic acid-binding protein